MENLQAQTTGEPGAAPAAPEDQPVTLTPKAAEMVKITREQ